MYKTHEADIPFIATYLGRFAPLHVGHCMTLGSIINKYGTHNCLVLIGSSTSYNNRTPYTFEQRKEMIQALYPAVRVIGIPDVNANLEFFDGNTNDIWLESIKEVEKELKVPLKFFGGSAVDLEILKTRFPTEIIINRQREGKGISATSVREFLKLENHNELEKFLHPKIMPLAIYGYNKFKEVNARNN